jgi:hypothetical protein
MSTDNDLSYDEAWELEVNGSEPETSETVTDTSTEANATQTEPESPVATDNTQDITSTTHEEDGTGNATNPTTIEEAVAQAKLWEQRFKSFEGSVNVEMERRRNEELDRQRQFVDALSKPPTNTKHDAEENTKLTKYQEFAKDFPEIAGPIEEFLNQRLSGTEELVRKAVEEKITPIAADLSQQKVSTHLERILAKHPDAIKLRQDGSLDAWINTLPVYAQHGARYVTNSGTSDEVVALLDQYKDYKNQKTNNQDTDKPTNDPGARSASPGMVEAVKAGLAVKAGRSADPKTDIKKNSKDDFDAGWEDAIKKLGMK